MQTMTLDQIDRVSGAVNWDSAGNSMLAFSGAAALGGLEPLALGLAFAAGACYLAATMH